MSKKGRFGAWFLVALTLLAFGCNKQDRERLCRVGGRVGAKADNLAGGPRDKLTNGWQALRASWDQVSVDARVSARLRWDRSLEQTSIEIHTDGDIVRLKGTVRDLEQRRRAVDLARTTIGVKDVIDELQMPASGQ